MKCPLCDSEESSDHTAEEVVFDDVTFIITTAVITSDRSGIPCAYHEKVIAAKAARQIKDRAMGVE